jgi:hypothetical protein
VQLAAGQCAAASAGGAYAALVDELAARLPVAPPWWDGALARLRAAPNGHYRAAYVVALACSHWRRSVERGTRRAPFDRELFAFDMGATDMQLEPPERFRAIAEGRL